MTSIADYLSENRTYMDEGSLSALEQMDDATFSVLVALDEALTGEGEPGMASKVALTSGTLADFDQSRLSSWTECRSRREAAGGVIYEGVQTRKGEQRIDLAVMQWGERVIALTV